MIDRPFGWYRHVNELAHRALLCALRLHLVDTGRREVGDEETVLLDARGEVVEGEGSQVGDGDGVLQLVVLGYVVDVQLVGLPRAQYVQPLLEYCESTHGTRSLERRNLFHICDNKIQTLLLLAHVGATLC